MKVVRFLQELVVTFFEDLTCAFSPKNWIDSVKGVASLTKKQWMINMMLIVPQIAFFYLVLSPAVAAPFYNKLLFFPTKTLAVDMETIAGTPKETVEFPSTNNSKLSAWYFPVTNSRGTVIISHGNGGNISHRVPLIGMLIKNNLSVLAYDYQGYGQSTGEPSIKNICQDGLAAYDYLVTTRGIEPAKIVVYGESLGGAVTSYIANHRKVGAIILQSTFSSLPHIARKRMPLMKLYPSSLFPDKLDNTQMLARDHAPVLIVHGKQDRLIPIEEAELLNSKLAEPKTFVAIDDAGHNDVYVEFQSHLNAAVSNFLDKVLN